MRRLTAVLIFLLPDVYALRAARRNGGVREPEHRLIIFGLLAIVAPFVSILPVMNHYTLALLFLTHSIF
jgi:hypothetical protein